MLPYDQAKHPVEKTFMPPYAVVRTWSDVPLFHGRGGIRFLTGSIAYAMRAEYSWLCGIKPMLNGLTIDPCIPPSFDNLTARFRYLHSAVGLEILNPQGREAGVRSMRLNGKRINETVVDPFSGCQGFLAAASLFDRGKNRIIVDLGSRRDARGSATRR